MSVSNTSAITGFQNDACWYSFENFFQNDCQGARKSIHNFQTALSKWKRFKSSRNYQFEIQPVYFKVPITVRLSSTVCVSSTASVEDSTSIVLGYLHVNLIPGSKSSCRVISSTSRRRRLPALLPVIM